MRTVTAAVALGAAVALASCSTGRQAVELSQAAPGAATTRSVASASDTVTVTETTTATATVTATVTVTVGPTVTVTALPSSTRSAAATFDRAIALVDYANLIADIRELDRIRLTGSQASLQLAVLANHFASLGAGGAPPGLDAPTYYARLKSLELFAAAASREAAAGSPQAAARYVVIRQETGTFLALVNGALGTTLTLPPPPATTPGP